MVAPTQLVNKPWMVKSGGAVLGPFSSREVEEKLLSKELVPLDEIIFNMGRWHYLRDELAFERVLIEIRARTGGATDGTQTHTKTDSLTKTLTVTETEKIGGPDYGPAIPAGPPVEETPRPQIPVSVKTFGMPGDQKMEEEVARRSIPTTLWVVALVAAAIVFGYSRKISKHGNARGDDEEFSVLIGEGTMAYRRGDRDAAKASFSRALEIKPDSTETALKLAPLLISDNETVPAKRILEKVLAIDKNNEVRIVALTALGLASIQEGHLDVAEKELARAAKIDKTHPVVAYNLGVLHYLKRNAKKAIDFFEIATSGANASGISVLMAGEVALLPHETKGNEILKSASAQIKKYLATGWDYRQENHILRARIESAQGHDSEAIREVDSAMDIDPNLTAEFIHDEMYYSSPVGWDRIVEWVRFLQNKTGNRPRFEALLGYCLFRGREKHEGKSHVDDALKQAPKDPFILAVASFIARSLGHEEEADVNLNIAMEMEGPVLPWLLKARLCEKRSDKGCAKDSYNKALKIRPDDVVALVGLGRLAYQSGNVGEARKFLGDVPSNSSHYGPFVRLGHDLASKGGGH